MVHFKLPIDHTGDGRLPRGHGNPGIDALYIAVPHNLHCEIYLRPLSPANIFSARNPSESIRPRMTPSWKN